jgi:uncharacterized protein (DUF779 family)
MNRFVLAQITTPSQAKTKHTQLIVDFVSSGTLVSVMNG